MQLDRTVAAALAAVTLIAGPAAAADDAHEVSRLDIAYQAAVKRNDAKAMAAILHPDFILVLGNGGVVSRQALLDEAMSGHVTYEQQDEDAGTQTVRLFGDTAVVTARLWLKGARDGQAFERRLWFSDTYVRTPQGWRYAFGQASMALPPA
jgi:ketosteroid isomerase-like protein